MPEFDPDDVIKLALANTSYGFGNFLRELYGNKKAKENQTLRLFSIHKSETGTDPFQVLQSTEKLEMVTDKEYKKRTGKSRLPKGTGRGTGGRPSKISETFGKGTKQAKDNQRNIPFPPQAFDWLNVVPLKEEENQYQELVDATDRGIVKFIVLPCEVGGRWGDTWSELIRVLAKEKALRAPKLLRRSAEFAWTQRWWNMLSVAAQASFASSLLGSVPEFRGGYVPRHSDVVGDSRYMSGPAFSRLPLRG